MWALRVGFLGLVVAIAGLAVMLSGSTPWILAVGVFVWLASAAAALTGVFWARQELEESKPGLWSTRLMLIHDTVRPRSSAQS